MPRKHNQFNDSLIENNRSHNLYFRRLCEMCLSRFKWKLPDTVDTRYLEMVLMSEGQALFFYDEVMGYLVMPFTNGGSALDTAGEPLKRFAYSGNNGYNRTLDETNSVIIHNNFLECNSVIDIEYYADKLYDLDQTIEVNTRMQKTPLFLKCNEKQELALRNMYRNITGNQPLIVIDKSIDPNELMAYPTQAPFVADKIYTLKQNLWNEALTTLGIPNIDTSKRERLITDEVTRAQGAITANKNSPLMMRQTACAQINKMFGLNTSCEFMGTEEEEKENEEGADINE